jgi:hypothetical protein
VEPRHRENLEELPESDWKQAGRVGGGRLPGSSKGSVDVMGGSGSGGPSAPAGSADGRQRVAAIQPRRCEIGVRPREPQKRREAGSLGVQGSQDGERRGAGEGGGREAEGRWLAADLRRRRR